MPVPNFDFYGLSAPFLTGNLTATVHDVDGDPNQVLDRTLPWTIQLNWQITGLVAGGLGGDWNIKVFVEPIGPGTGMQIASSTVPLATVPPPSPRTYNATLSISAGTIPSDGTYKLTAVVTHTNLGFPDRMAGFYEGPILQFFSAP